MARKSQTAQQTWRATMREITAQGELAMTDHRSDDMRLEFLIRQQLDMLAARGIIRAEEVCRAGHS